MRAVRALTGPTTAAQLLTPPSSPDPVTVCHDGNQIKVADTDTDDSLPALSPSLPLPGINVSMDIVNNVAGECFILSAASSDDVLA